MTDTITIQGNRISLPDNREVWAGKHDESWYIQFTSSTGSIHRVRISYEAADALVELIGSNSPIDLYKFLLRITDGKSEWKNVSSEV